MAVRIAIEHPIGTLPRTPFPASREFPSRGNEKIGGTGYCVTYDTDSQSRNVLASPLGEEGHEVAKGWTVVRMIMTLDMDVTAERRHYNNHCPTGNPQPSARRAVKLKNPPAVRPVHLKNLHTEGVSTGASHVQFFPACYIIKLTHCLLKYRRCMERYRNYSDYLKERYGEKVYKIPVSLPVTCPNRDGCLSSGGCIFCGSIGADYETKAVGMGITRQLDRSMAHVGPKYKARKFIAYFLNFTNTYAPLSDFKSWVEEAMSHPAVVAVDVSTRPDCIHEAYLDVLKEASLKYGKDVTVELGLQSSNVHTLSVLNRCHGLAEFIDASLRIGRYGFDLCTHVIADLPWDDRLDVAETAKIISALPVTEVKLHSLYIVKGTKLADMYEKGEVSLLPMEEYMERAVLFLSYLRKDIVVQRMVGRASGGNTITVNGGSPWWEVKDRIDRLLEERNITQGCRCHYLDGRAVRRFLK